MTESVALRLNEQAVICLIPQNSTFASGWCARCLAPQYLPPIRRTNSDGLMLTLPALLFHNGLPNLPQSLIEPHRNRAGVWRIKFSYEAGEPLSMDVVQAATMAAQLRELGEVELADEVTSAVTSATRYATM